MRHDLLALMLLVSATPVVRLDAAELRGRAQVDGRPAVGVEVAAEAFEAPLEAARREARGTPAPPPLARTQTRADGSFVLALGGAPADTTGAPQRAVSTASAAVRLVLSGRGVVTHVLDDVFGFDEDADVGAITLVPARALAGRVVDGRGGPVIGATVTLGRASGLPGSEATAMTGADGAFHFAAAAELNNRVRIAAAGFACAELGRVRAGALPRPVKLALEERIEGRVLRADGRAPAAGALVRFEGRATSRWFEAGPDGRFTVEGLPAEEGRVVARHDEGEASSSWTPARRAPLTLTLAPGGVVRGRVLDAVTRAPLAHRRVVARAQALVFVALTRADGGYALEGLPARTYTLSVDDARHVPWQREGVRVTRAGESVQDALLAPAAALRGRVVDELGAPIENAEGRLLTSERRDGFAPWRDSVSDVVFTSGRDGSFSASRLPPGRRVSLRVSHDDHEPRVVGGLRLQAGAAPAQVTVVLRRGLVLTGRVRDAERRPIAGAEVRLLRVSDVRAGRGGARFMLGRFDLEGARPERTSGPDGRFEWRGLTPGDYTLTVTHPGYARQVVDPIKLAREPALEPLDVALTAGATLSGFVRDSQGQGVEGVGVSARRAGEAASLRLGLIMSREPTGPDGAFLIEGVVAGASYDLVLLGVFPPLPSASGVTAPADGIDLRVPGRGRIRGTVSDAQSGQPVSDFAVSYHPARQAGGRMLVRFSDGRGGPGQAHDVHADDGRFTLEDVSAGTWDVEVRAAGYPPARVAGVTVEEGADTPDVDVRLTRGAAVSGRVLEAASGRPVAEASVRAEVQGGGGFFRPTSTTAEAVSDGDGRFRIDGLEPGTWLVTATHAEWSEASRSLTVGDDGLEGVELRLGRGATLAGLVTAGGRPLSGAEVALAPSGDDARFAPPAEDVSDETGRFAFERLAPGRYAVSATHGTRSSAPLEVLLAAGQARDDVRLELSGGARVTGRVTGLPDERLSGVHVSAMGGDDYSASTRTGPAGAFEFAGVPAGPLALRARAGDALASQRSASTIVTVQPTLEDVTAEIAFTGGLRVEGHVSRAGQPVAGARVMAVSPAGAGSTAGATTDDSGAYALEDLREGRYDLFVSSFRGGSAAHRTLELSSDQTLDFELPSARVEGQVLEADTQRPLGDVQVNADAPERPHAAVAVSDSNGRFTLRDIEPGAYRVSFNKPAYVSETRTLNAAESGPEVQVELRRGEGLALTARDASYGTPLRGLLVHVLDASGVPVFTGSVALDSDGRGEVPSLRPGVYELRAAASSYAPLFLPGVSVPSAALELRLSAGGTLEVRCGPQTQARPGARLRLIDGAGRPLLPTIFAAGPDVPLGQPLRRLENLPPGRYSIVLDVGGEPARVELHAGATSVLNLP